LFSIVQYISACFWNKSCFFLFNIAKLQLNDYVIIYSYNNI
jgi:hypothetical protein